MCKTVSILSSFLFSFPCTMVSAFINCIILLWTTFLFSWENMQRVLDTRLLSLPTRVQWWQCMPDSYPQCFSKHDKHFWRFWSVKKELCGNPLPWKCKCKHMVIEIEDKIDGCEQYMKANLFIYFRAVNIIMKHRNKLILAQNLANVNYLGSACCALTWACQPRILILVFFFSVLHGLLL